MPTNHTIDELARASLLLASGVLTGRQPELDSGVLTLSEVAALLRVPDVAVRRLAVHGDIPGRLIDGEWRFLKSTVLGWLAGGGSRRVTTASGWKEDAHFPKEEWRPATAWSEEANREAEEFIKRIQDARNATVPGPVGGAES